MHDPKLANLANVLVNYSTRLQAGEKVGIIGPLAAEPLMVEVYRYADGELFYENGEFAVSFADRAANAPDDGGPYSMGAMFRRRERRSIDGNH